MAHERKRYRRARAEGVEHLDNIVSMRRNASRPYRALQKALPRRTAKSNGHQKPVFGIGRIQNADISGRRVDFEVE